MSCRTLQRNYSQTVGAAFQQTMKMIGQRELMLLAPTACKSARRSALGSSCWRHSR